MWNKLKHIWQKNLLRVRTVLQTSLDFARYMLLPAPRLPVQSKSDKPVILFLGDSLQARIPRMAKWLQRSGEFECMLLVAAGKNFRIFDTDIFSQSFTYRSRWHLRHILKGLPKVYAIHAFTLPSYQIRMAIDHTGYPVVMDIQDMHVSYFGLNSPKLYMRLDMPDESYSIQHAAGIVTQSIELTNASRVYDIPKRPPTLFFPVYCDDDQLLTPPTIPSMEEIHLVYAGSIAGSFQDDHHFGSMKLYRLADTLAEQQIHFHIYPSPTMRFRDLILAEYEELAKRNPYFTLHESVPQQVLAEELMGYHFGLLPFFLEDTGRSANKLGLGSSQKLYNYMESGLPVLISEDLRFQSWMARRYGGGVEIRKADLPNLREMITKLDYPALRADLMAKRNRVTLSTNIPRLAKFYHQLNP